MTAQEKLATYEPVKVIIGILKNKNTIDARICVDKKSIIESVEQFDAFRIWKLEEEDSKFYIDKVNS